MQITFRQFRHYGVKASLSIDSIRFILFFFSNFCVISVSALLPAIDLLEALELPTNYSRYIGVSIAQGMEKHLAFKLGK